MSLQITPARSTVILGDAAVANWQGAAVVIDSTDFPAANWNNISVLDVASVITLNTFISLTNCAVKDGFFPLSLTTSAGQLTINNCGLGIASTDSGIFSSVKGTVEILNEPNLTSAVPLYLTIGEADVAAASLTLNNVGIQGGMTFELIHPSCSVVVTGCSGITSITFIELIGFASQTLSVINNTNISSINVASLSNVAGYVFEFGGLALTESVVDQLFIDIAAKDGTDTPGIIYTDGGTSAAPTATSLAARTSLAGLGWTIATN